MSRPALRDLYYSFGYYVRRYQAATRQARTWAHEPQTERIFQAQGNDALRLVYRGPESLVEAARQLLGTSAEPATGPGAPIEVSTKPSSGAFLSPLTLCTVVRSDVTLEQVLESYGKSLRRAVAALRDRFHYEVVTDREEILLLEREMLRPYAAARHGESAVQISVDEVVRMAQSPKGALLKLVTAEGRTIGCQLGHTYVRDGQCCWHVNRVGYLPEIFENPQAWGDANAVSLFLSIEVAAQRGATLCDYGPSHSLPGDGLLEWKRRRKGFLRSDWKHEGLWVKVPASLAPAAFFHQPLFEVRGPHIRLHLGWPADQTIDQVTQRNHQMGFLGLAEVEVHTAVDPDDAARQAIQALFADDPTPPRVVFTQS